MLYEDKHGKRIAAFDDVFIVRYSCEEDGNSLRGLVEHSDAGDVSFMGALSRPKIDFEGGGTRFKRGQMLGLGDSEVKEPIDGDGSTVVQCDQGTVLSFPAALRHSGVPITSGTRMLLVGFCYLDEAQSGRPGNVDLSLSLIKEDLKSLNEGTLSLFSTQ
jgi:hypothetical protein